MEYECIYDREVGNQHTERWTKGTVYCNNDSLDSGIAGLKDLQFNDKNDARHTDIEPVCSEYIVDPSTGTIYMKGKFLGKGGFAHVHELMDLTTNTVYAGKIISKNRITKRQHMQKIAREILIHRDLIHEHVVRLHHFFEDKVNAYIILENCSRKSLVHILKHRYLVTEPEARYYLRQLVSGVQYIHSQKVIHRDLKPGNMLLSEKMVVKLGDFGLATQADKNKKVSICGTPNYIAPEVLNKLRCSYEADIWAIGCIMYTILVGQPPFETSSLRETYNRIVSNRYRVPPAVSEPAQVLIKKLLEPEPKDRPSLDEIFNYEFFAKGYTPQKLSPFCCFSVPKFPIPDQVMRPEPWIQVKHTSPLNEDMKVITKSVSGLKISSQKSSNVDVQILPKKISHCSSPCPSSGKGHGTDRVARSEHKGKEKDVTLKQKLSSMLCPDKISLCRKKGCDAATLYHVLVGCLNTMPTAPPEDCATRGNPPPLNYFPLFVSKWIDYSNKYGFSFQLTDKSVGVLFNDNTRMSFTPDRRHVEFHDVHGKVTAHPEHSVPAPLQGRLVLLRYFSRYMDENLTDGGNLEVPPVGHKSPVPHMKRWVRTMTVMIMELHNGTLQINFFKDHTKLIISYGKQGYLVTYINSLRQSCSYWLHQIAQVGCENEIVERLHFAAAVLREFAELDGVKV